MPPIPPFMRTWKHRPFETEGLWFRTTNLPPFHPVPELSLITTIKVLKDPQDWVFVGRRWRVLGQVTIPCFSQDLAVHLRDWKGRVVVFCVVQVPICLFLHMTIRSFFKKVLVSPSSSKTVHLYEKQISTLMYPKKHILPICDRSGMVKHDPFKGWNRDLQLGYMKVRNWITWEKKHHAI